MPCKHAALAAIYAQQMAEMDEPWKLWEVYTLGRWLKLAQHPVWDDNNEYRQIPKTININGHEVPEPMREKPDVGDRYWTIDPRCHSSRVCFFTWYDNEKDNLTLTSGLCHTTKEAAIAHAKALFSFTEVK